METYFVYQLWAYSGHSWSGKISFVSFRVTIPTTSGQFVDPCGWCLRPRPHYAGGIRKLNSNHFGFVVVENSDMEITLFS